MKIIKVAKKEVTPFFTPKFRTPNKKRGKKEGKKESDVVFHA